MAVMATYSSVERDDLDLVVSDRWGTVVLVVETGHGPAAAMLATKCSVAQDRRRYTDAARANAALEGLPGYAEAVCDPSTDDAYRPADYPR